MIKQIRYRGITWIDLENPTQDELKTLARSYDLHPVIVDELAKPSLQSKLDLYEKYIYLVLRLPNFDLPQNSKSEDSNRREVDFVLGRDFLITTHYELIEPVEEFAQIFEADLARHKTNSDFHAGFLLFYIIRRLYRTLGENLNNLNEELRKVEGKIFSGQEKETIERLAEINRFLLDFRWEIRNHAALMTDLDTAGRELFGNDFAKYLTSLHHAYDQIWGLLESNLDIFADLRSINESLLSIKTNETTKLLTVLAFIFFPLTLLTGIFNMNTHLPFVGRSDDFLIVSGLMILMTLLMYVVARLRQWL